MMLWVRHNWQGYRQTNAYVVTQWPLAETVNDIWRMAYEYNISTIVLLNEESPSNVSALQYYHQQYYVALYSKNSLDRLYGFLDFTQIS